MVEPPVVEENKRIIPGATEDMPEDEYDKEFAELSARVTQILPQTGALCLGRIVSLARTRRKIIAALRLYNVILTDIATQQYSYQIDTLENHISISVLLMADGKLLASHEEDNKVKFVRVQ